jgi:hypothetical protein
LYDYDIQWLEWRIEFSTKQLAYIHLLEAEIQELHNNLADAQTCVSDLSEMLDTLQINNAYYNQD